MPTLDLETYARVLAQAACRPDAPLADIARAAGIGEKDLSDGEASIRSEIAALWDGRRGIQAMKFASALGTELLKLGLITERVPGLAEGAGTPDRRPALPDAPGFAAPSYLRHPPPQREAPVSTSSTSFTTEEVDVRMFRRPALPFAERVVPLREEYADRTATVMREAPRVPEARAVAQTDDGSGTVLLPPGHPAVVAALPFAGAGGLRLSLEEYAALRVALSARGEEDAGVLRQFGIPSLAAKAEIEADFARRFRADPSLQQEFVELVGKLSSRRSGGGAV